ncbi:hypothetical protein ACFVU3_39775 [Streptomyces sp. NPDC058052]
MQRELDRQAGRDDGSCGCIAVFLGLFALINIVAFLLFVIGQIIPR